MTNNQLTDERLVKILSETQATIMEHNSRCVRGSVEVDARLFESMIMELQERRKAAMGSEPVAWTWQFREQWHVTNDQRRAEIISKDGFVVVQPLYRHAQQPVVPDVMEPTIEAIKGILPTSNPDEYAACIGADMWNACRAAMLSAAPQEVKP